MLIFLLSLGNEKMENAAYDIRAGTCCLMPNFPASLFRWTPSICTINDDRVFIKICERVEKFAAWAIRFIAIQNDYGVTIEFEL